MAISSVSFIMASVREAKVLPIKPYRYDAERQGSDLSRHPETSPEVTPVASRITVFPGQNMHPFRTTKGDAMKDAPMTASNAQRQQGRQIEHTRLLVEMHESTARIAQRTEFLRRMWSEGLPTNCSVGDVLVLLDAQLNRTVRQ